MAKNNVMMNERIKKIYYRNKEKKTIRFFDLVRCWSNDALKNLYLTNVDYWSFFIY